MVKRKTQRRTTTAKKNTKKSAPKVKTAPRSRRSSVKKPSRRTADDRANKAFKNLIRSIKKKQEGSE